MLYLMQILQFFICYRGFENKVIHTKNTKTNSNFDLK